MKSRIFSLLSSSNHPAFRFARGVRRGILEFTLPAPRMIVKPVLFLFIAIRSTYYFLYRVLVCEPLFKAYCTRYGRRLRTDVFVHWLQGAGEMIFGDDCLVDGKCSFTFARRYSDRPTLIVGDRTGIGHGCRFTVGKRISIGKDCRIASDVWILDSSGHSADPASRLAGQPAPEDEVRPVTIEDNVWIGSNSIIFPGVTVGAGAVISAGAVVMSDVPRNTIVSGNPARRIGALQPVPKDVATITSSDQTVLPDASSVSVNAI